MYLSPMRYDEYLTMTEVGKLSCGLKLLSEQHHNFPWYYFHVYWCSIYTRTVIYIISCITNDAKHQYRILVSIAWWKERKYYFILRIRTVKMYLRKCFRPAQLLANYISSIKYSDYLGIYLFQTKYYSLCIIV